MIARRRRTNSNSDKDSPNSNYYVGVQNIPQTYVQHNTSPPPPPPKKDPEMSCRDRTNEFMSAVKSMQSRHVSINSCEMNTCNYLRFPVYKQQLT